MYGCTDGRMGVWIDGLIDGWMDGLMHWCIDGLAHWTDICRLVFRRTAGVAGSSLDGPSNSSELYFLFTSGPKTQINGYSPSDSLEEARRTQYASSVNKEELDIFQVTLATFHRYSNSPSKNNRYSRTYTIWTIMFCSCGCCDHIQVKSTPISRKWLFSVKWIILHPAVG